MKYCFCERKKKKKKNSRRVSVHLKKIEKLIFFDSRGKVTIQILIGIQEKKTNFHIATLNWSIKQSGAEKLNNRLH